MDGGRVVATRTTDPTINPCCTTNSVARHSVPTVPNSRICCQRRGPLAAEQTVHQIVLGKRTVQSGLGGTARFLTPMSSGRLHRFRACSPHPCHPSCHLAVRRLAWSPVDGDVQGYRGSRLARLRLQCCELVLIVKTTHWHSSSTAQSESSMYCRTPSVAQRCQHEHAVADYTQPRSRHSSRH
jgi:hypothetical protein